MSHGIELNPSDVISTKQSPFKFVNLFKVNLLLATSIEWVPAHLLKWFEEGVECQILKIEGGGWQRGKVRFYLQFIPDEPIETNSSSAVSISPLEDLRRSLDIY